MANTSRGVTNTEKEIIFTMTDLGLEKDAVIGFMCVLRKFNAQEKMLKWLKKNNDKLSESKETAFHFIFDKVTDIFHGLDKD